MSTPRKTSLSRRPSSITSAARKRPKRSASAATLAKRKAAAKARKAATVARQRERAKAQRSAQATRKRSAAAAKRQRDRERARAAAVDTRPPSSPIIPCDDPYVGQQFNARVNCKPYTTLSGKTRQRCDTQRVVVVGCATPPAGQPRRKQLFAAQAGSRFTIPDREIRRDLRLAGRPVEVPARRRRSDAADLGGDTSFDFGQNGRKPNHHGGHHESGDPLGVYLPPLGRWRVGSGGHRSWEHPSLHWWFEVWPLHGGGFGAQAWNMPPRVADASLRKTFMQHRRHESADAARDAIARWYAAQTLRRVSSEGRDAIWARKSNHHGGEHDPSDPLGAYLPPLSEWRRSADGLERVWVHPTLRWKFSVVGPFGRQSGGAYPDTYRSGVTQSQRPHYLFGTAEEYPTEEAAYAPLRRWYAAQRLPRKANPSYSDRGGRICDYCHNSKAPGVRLLSCPYGNCPSVAACKSCTQTNRHRWSRAAHAGCAARGAKPNRAPAGAVPGQTYFDRRADPLLGRRVSGERYAGEVRVRAVGVDGRTASHVVGGHILPRSRVRAGVIREEIRAGLRPAPVRRQRPAAPRPLLLGPGGVEPGRSFVQRFGTGGGVEPGRSFVQRFGTGGGAEPLRPRAPVPSPAKKPRAPAKKGAPTNEELFLRLQEKLRDAFKSNRRRGR